MGKPTGFKEHSRQLPGKRAVKERVQDYKELYLDFPEEQLKTQASRCMDCGVPTCHAGCPLGNLIPDWNDLVYRNRWREALKQLHSTNNFPEFTGRLCPAPCEEACVLGINEPAVTIEEIEKSIVEHGFEAGWINPRPPKERTGKKVAIIGSGPAGLACAQQLNRAGHEVVVMERDHRVGGLLSLGIPDFKMEKWVVDRRVQILEAEGIDMRTNVNVGKDVTADDLKAYDAVVLCIGSTRPRDLKVPGRELDGVHFAMDFLTQQNKRISGNEDVIQAEPILATDKDVIVIGGGDTGSDCIGTSNRHGAKSVTNFELLPQPPEGRPESEPWPYWPMRLRTSTSHEEGCERFWSLLTKEFKGSNGKLESLTTVELEWTPGTDGGRPQMTEVAGSEKEWPAQLVLLAMGFLGPETSDSIVDQLGVELDERGNVKTDAQYATNVPGVFAAGDGRRGQSLIVWAISEGREAARGVDCFLVGDTDLPMKDGVDLPRA